MSEIKKKIKEIIEKNLEKIYEDNDVIVYIGLSDQTIKEIILTLLKERPMTISELDRYLIGITGKERARKLLAELIEEKKVKFDHITNLYMLND